MSTSAYFKLHAAAVLSITCRCGDFTPTSSDGSYFVMSIHKTRAAEYAGCTNWFVKSDLGCYRSQEVCLNETVSPCEDETATTAACATAHQLHLLCGFLLRSLSTACSCQGFFFFFFCLNKGNGNWLLRGGKKKAS